MNQDSIWQILRYVILFGGGLAVGRGWITNEQLALIVGAIGSVFAVLWGVYVKWNTTPVPTSVAVRQDLPAVSGATGMVK